jgi:lipopolysaccharide/colanic/teichoic acid biosynthesis glycosyltransferase
MLLKRGFDLGLSTLGLMVSCPRWALIALAIKLRSVTLWTARHATLH